VKASPFASTAAQKDEDGHETARMASLAPVAIDSPVDQEPETTGTVEDTGLPFGLVECEVLADGLLAIGLLSDVRLDE
jgi:hypothetical protein